ncbi:MAG: protein-methionine-sulfoxide reductase catalytic subunit MsrP [Nitrospirae bacterium]|nr:protein-methionine-sulfoxide reductase catalytic subunit MsrP [Nitrospirota bacterium]MBF0540368.1 protein-methionine-sulfoxide reductase catalytic subunit MsrP [Nitrospirota bacterium]
MSKNFNSKIKSSEITDKQLYLNRRKFMKKFGSLIGWMFLGSHIKGVAEAAALKIVKKYDYTSNDKPTNIQNVTHYNNFYEFSTEKEDVADLSKDFTTNNWNISVEGLVNKPKVYGMEDLLKLFPLEERIYRHRCVEGWSMVVPWIGFPLSNLLKLSLPQGSAKFVEFTTVYRPDQMPGQKRSVLNWPYVEGLRIDEAMHPLAILSVGMYGDVLPNQDGAPIRLIVPWKYGFKSIKSIVRIKLVENMPISTWMQAASNEYGFYANVNPQVDHPRWSQKKERRLGEFFKRDTLMFNGYTDLVGHLYTNMDLRKNF